MYLTPVFGSILPRGGAVSTGGWGGGTLMGVAPHVRPMGDRDSDQTNPLSPYYPSETPTLPGNGRTWFALLIAGMLLMGVIYTVLTLFLTL